jgi:lysine 2,3-aminomutase
MGAMKKYPDGITAREWNDGRWQFKNRIHTLPRLARALDLPLSELGIPEAVVDRYPFSITPYYLSLLDPVHARDPLRLQCFPDVRELEDSEGGVDDPLAEERDMPVPGLIHRYPDRCLAVVTNVCGLFCRHCNRKRLWRKPLGACLKRDLQRMVDYVAQEKGIREVIISGGDALTLQEDKLDWLLGAFRALPHVEVLRVGSRLPVVMPMAITRKLSEMLKRHRPLWFMTQFNHPREITKEAAEACEKLLDAGIPLSSQTVLLKEVNDSYDALRDLFQGLERISVRPYYLFQCDPVRGTDHFRADIRKGMDIMDKLWKSTSGLCIPRYVADLPGGRGKVPLESCVSARSLTELSAE